MATRVALITGGSRGIGAAIAARLAQDGITTILPTRQEMDLLSDASMDAYVASIKGPIDILVNNAGINVVAQGPKVTDQQIHDTVQTNLVAPLRLVRALAPRMIEQGYGRVLNISSIWGVVAKAGRVTYSMSKTGIIGMTRTLAVELAPHGVLVNALAPGYVSTELTLQNNTPAEIDAISRTIPLGRLAEPSEIAEAAAFLVSERNTYITGQLILADGGYACL